MSFPQPSDYRPPIIPDGEVYDNPENGRSYYWTQILLPEGSTPDTATSIGGYWTVVCDSASGKYVLKTGDTMTGTLEIANEGDATDLEFDPDKANLTFTTTKTDGSASESVFIHQNGIRWDDSARLEWSEFNVEIPKPVENDVSSEGFIIRGTTANGYETNDALDEDGRLLSVYHNAGEADAVNYAGKINNTNNLVNKGYVDNKDEILRQNIIELEEEIDAIAPSVDYGTWEWKEPNNNTFGRPPEPGTFYLGDIAGNLTTEYKSAVKLVIHNDEWDNPGDTILPLNHSWADADVGKLIQLFDAADPDFMLGEITDRTIDPVGEFVIFTIEVISSLGQPNDNLDQTHNKYLTRINVFAPPSGGSADGFVKIIGDTMTGNLKITTDANTDKAAALTLEGQRPDKTKSCGTIKFDNATSGTEGYIEYHAFGTADPWFQFTQDVQFSNKNLSKLKDIKFTNPGTISCGEHTAITFKSAPTSSTGDAHVIVETPKDTQRKGFIIRGRNSDGYDRDLFFNYRNSGNGGDSIDYTGICTSGTHVMNRDHGLDLFVQTGSKGIKITKSGNTYYIQGP